MPPYEFPRRHAVFADEQRIEAALGIEAVLEGDIQVRSILTVLKAELPRITEVAPNAWFLEDLVSEEGGLMPSISVGYLF